MAQEKMPRSVTKQRLNKWRKSNQPVCGHVEPDEVDGAPEGGLLDKAKVKLLGKPAKKKEKPWALECKWNSRADYEKHIRPIWRDRHPYTTKWWSPLWSSGKFTTLAGARDNFKTRGLQTFYDEVSGRSWRIRNTKTGAIYHL